jgi:hypothetical protein
MKKSSHSSYVTTCRMKNGSPGFKKRPILLLRFVLSLIQVLLTMDRHFQIENHRSEQSRASESPKKIYSDQGIHAGFHHLMRVFDASAMEFGDLDYIERHE